MIISLIVTIILLFVSVFLFVRKQNNKDINKGRLRILNNLKRANYASFTGICELGLCTQHLIGIVCFPSKVRREFNALLIEACEEMGVYSGNRTYPIKDISGLMRPNIIFNVAAQQVYPDLGVNGMWDEETSYGRSRVVVLKLLISKYENLLKG